MNTSRFTTVPVWVAVALLALLASPASFAAAKPIAITNLTDDSADSAAVQSKLNKSQFKNVTVNVQNGVATLSGSVDLYEYKADADKRVHKVKGVTAVRNDIEVAGPTIADQDLESKLGEKLKYDRVGYGNVFDAITLNVQNGVVTLAGSALDYPSRDSALAVVSTYPGVKDVVDNIQVDPASPMDDGIRMAVARAIYGYPSLNKYSVDPAKSIRIVVKGGNVELDGIVDNQADKDTANIRANAVPNVFSVKNNLQVANQTSETARK
jgi:osmotically-inducible protein OsmY